MNLIIQYKVDTIEQLKRAVRSQAKFKKKSASIVFSSVDSTSLIRFEFWCRRLISNYHKKHKHKIPISCSSLKLSGWKDPRDSGGHLPVRNFAFPTDDASRRQSRHFRKVDNQSRFFKVWLLSPQTSSSSHNDRAETLRMTDYQRQNSGQTEVQRPRVRIITVSTNNKT